LNCAAPEDLIASLHGMFDKKTKDDVDLEDELIKQNIGFCVYANLNERAYHNESQGYDRSKDDPNKILRDEKMTFDGHIGYINAIEHILKNFKAVTHIGLVWFYSSAMCCRWIWRCTTDPNHLGELSTFVFSSIG